LRFGSQIKEFWGLRLNDAKASFKLDGPIGVVEELLPAFVTRLAEVNVDKQIMLRPGGSADEGQACLFWSSAAFFHVAFSTGADHILPARFSACAARDNVVEGKLAGGVAFAAILAAVFVACEDAAAIEFDLAPWQAVVEQQADNMRDGDVDMVDSTRFAQRWLESDCGLCGGADFDCNEEVGIEDLAELVNNWLAE
jgi:hypothetical protein